MEVSSDYTKQCGITGTTSHRTQVGEQLQEDRLSNEEATVL